MLVLFVLAVGVFLGWFAYRKAKQNGHNPIRWTIIAIINFLLTEIISAGCIGFILGLGEIFWDWSKTLLDDYRPHSEIIYLLVTFFTNWLFVLRPLNKVPDKSFDAPTLPTFEQSEK